LATSKARVERVSPQEKLDFLRRPASYPDAPASVEVRETHMSWVFLTRRLVYKMKKPVKLPYLDFSTLAARHYFCRESLRLNRRLAASVYQDVVALTSRRGGGLELGGSGQAVEWLEQMRRLPEARMLDRVIAEDADAAAQALPAAQLLAEFYRTRPRLALDPGEYLDVIARAVRDNVGALLTPEFGLDEREVLHLEQALNRTLGSRRELFARRVAAGQVVEGHGDLRPEHVCLTDPPVVIDCLEFSRPLRIVDPVDELSYLTLECERLGADLNRQFFDAYQQATADAPPPGLVSFFKVHRAMIRARLAVWHLADHDNHDKWIGRARDYLRLALDHAEGL
jgi:uncharacterized protein